MKAIIKIASYLSICLFLASCVSTKKFNEQKSLADKYLAESTDCNEKLNAKKSELELVNAQLEKLTNDNSTLSNERDQLMTLKNKLNNDIIALNEQIEKLGLQNKILLAQSSEDREKLNASLLQKTADLIRKEDQVNLLSKDLKEREDRIRNLESILNKQDSATNYLKNKLLEALTGFNSNELSVIQKDGKIYVSMSDKLLFKSGSYEIDTKGKEALAKVAGVLKKQNTFNIVVEGHTDNDAFISPIGSVKDNWDLSVMRATTITKILVDENKLDARKVIASGHGQYNPIVKNDSPENKARNRRTEIILSPDLNDLYKILSK
ncbi:MAG: OmpA family protein [Bacteroidota bacterium]